MCTIVDVLVQWLWLEKCARILDLLEVYNSPYNTHSRPSFNFVLSSSCRFQMQYPVNDLFVCVCARSVRRIFVQ